MLPTRLPAAIASLFQLAGAIVMLFRPAVSQSLPIVAHRRWIGAFGLLGCLSWGSFLLALRFFFLFGPLYPVSLGALKAVIGSAHSVHSLLGDGCGRGLSKNRPWLGLGLHPVLVRGDPRLSCSLGVETADCGWVGVRDGNLYAEPTNVKRHNFIDCLGVWVRSHD